MANENQTGFRFRCKNGCLSEWQAEMRLPPRWWPTWSTVDGASRKVLICEACLSDHHRAALKHKEDAKAAKAKKAAKKGRRR